MYLLAKRSHTVSRPGDAPPSASTLVETYLGRDAGRVVLSGRIVRGRSEVDLFGVHPFPLDARPDLLGLVPLLWVGARRSVRPMSVSPGVACSDAAERQGAVRVGPLTRQDGQ
jgi:hypothetical protein